MPAHQIVLLGWATAALAASLAWALRARARERRLVGRVLARETPGRAWRVLACLAASLALALAVALGGAGELAWGAPLFALTVLVVLVAPFLRDRVSGSEGVRHGWTVRSFAELAEWRLTGEHLRFRVREEWLATPMPPEHRADVEARLRAVAPDRESRFA